MHMKNLHFLTGIQTPLSLSRVSSLFLCISSYIFFPICQFSIATDLAVFSNIQCLYCYAIPRFSTTIALGFGRYVLLFCFPSICVIHSYNKSFPFHSSTNLHACNCVGMISWHGFNFSI